VEAMEMVEFQHHHQCLHLQHSHQHDGDHGNHGHHAQHHVVADQENVTDNVLEQNQMLNVLEHIDKLVFVTLIYVQVIIFGYHGLLGVIALDHVVLDNKFDVEDVLDLHVAVTQFKFNNAPTLTATLEDHNGMHGLHGQTVPNHVQVVINIDFVLVQHDKLMLVMEKVENFNLAI